MADIAFITDRIATGAGLRHHPVGAAADLADWVDAGITHIIDNRIEADDRGLVARLAPQVEYLHNGQDDGGQRMPDPWFDAGARFATEALTDPAAKVLAHCHMGINRGPSMAYALLLTTGWDPVEALDALRAARPIAGAIYAEDALDWHHRRSGTSLAEYQADRRRLAQWRDEHPLDLPRIIRRRREAERAGSDPAAA